MAARIQITRAQLQAIQGLDPRGVLAFEALFKADSFLPGDIVWSGVTSGVVTITIASPGVVTWASHGLLNTDPVVFSTTGALPTGITAGTTYFVVNAAANTFQIAATPGGAAINTSGSQSGTQTAVLNKRDDALPANGAAVSRTLFPDLFARIGTTYGAGDGSTTFNIPNVAAVSGCRAFVIV